MNEGLGEVAPGNEGEATPDQWARLIDMLGNEFEVRKFASVRFQKNLWSPLLKTEAEDILRPNPHPVEATLEDLQRIWKVEEES